MKYKKKHYGFFETNMLILILAIAFITFGAMAQQDNFITGILITEYMILVFPVIIYGIIRKIDIKKALRLNKIPIKVLGKTFILGLFIVPIIAFGNSIMTLILEILDLNFFVEMPHAKNIRELFTFIFVVGITPGICEEIFFRGMVLNAYENRLNKKKAIFMSGLLFGIFHFNIQNLIGPIFIGIIFSYLVIITDSIIPAIIGHSLNNSIASILGYISNFISEIDNFEKAPPDLGVINAFIVFIILGFLALVSFIIIYFIIKNIKKDMDTDYTLYEENSWVIFREKIYFIVKIKKDGWVIIEEIEKNNRLEVEACYSSMKFISNESLKKEKLKRKYYFDSNYVKGYKLFFKSIPIFLFILMYIIITYLIFL